MSSKERDENKNKNKNVSSHSNLKPNYKGKQIAAKSSTKSRILVEYAMPIENL